MKLARRTSGQKVSVVSDRGKGGRGREGPRADALGRPVAVGVAIVVRLLGLGLDIPQLERRVRQDVALGLPLEAEGRGERFEGREGMGGDVSLTMEERKGVTMVEGRGAARVDLVLGDEERLSAVDAAKRGGEGWEGAGARKRSQSRRRAVLMHPRSVGVRWSAAAGRQATSRAYV